VSGEGIDLLFEAISNGRSEFQEIYLPELLRYCCFFFTFYAQLIFFVNRKLSLKDFNQAKTQEADLKRLQEVNISSLIKIIVVVISKCFAGFKSNKRR